MRLKFGLPWDRSVAFFLFSKNAKQKKDFWISFLRNHVILWAIFRSQIRFDSQYQLREELNKFFFPCRFGINHFQKNLIWTRFLGSVFEFVIKKKVHYSINNYKILNTVFTFFLISGAIYVDILQQLRLFIKIRNMKGVWTKIHRLALHLIFYKQLEAGFSPKSCL